MAEEDVAQLKHISAVVALGCDQTGRVLLTSFAEGGQWSWVDGELAEGEDAATGAARFAHDDRGLEIAAGQELAQLSGKNYLIIHECGAHVTYRATVFDATPLGQARHTPMRTRWFSIEERGGSYLDEFASAVLTDSGFC